MWLPRFACPECASETDADASGDVICSGCTRRFEHRNYGLTEIVHPNVGFLTFASLADAAAPLGLRGRFFPSRGPFVWRVRRECAWIRLRRAPAAFGVWVA